MESTAKAWNWLNSAAETSSCRWHEAQPTSPPADRIVIQQRHLGQLTFDTTAKTERHLHAERVIDTQWNLLMTNGEAGHWFVGAVNDQLGISHQPEGAGLHYPAA